MEIQHLSDLQALRIAQTKSGSEVELVNFKESSEAEFQRLMRVHKNDAKNALKVCHL